MAITLTNESPVGPKQEWLGALYVTDANILLRPGAMDSGQPIYDRDRANEILSYGFDEDHEHGDATTIITGRPLHIAMEIFGYVFDEYVDANGPRNRCRVEVRYFTADGTRLNTQMHGTGSDHWMRINIYCGVPKAQTEVFLRKLLHGREGGDPVVIVRPDDSPAGYSVRRYDAVEVHGAYEG